jgi:DNA-binding MarR family transcriptional regulator
MPAPQTSRTTPNKKGGTSKRNLRSSVRRTPGGLVLDLDKYLPGLLTLIASNLSGGASSAYLSLYGVGIETWRVMVMLAIEGRVTAQRMVQLLDADKGSISRTFKTMQEQGLLHLEADANDGRVRHAVFTEKGRGLHDRILRLALVREAAAISVLSDAELATLRDLLRRVYVALPQVEQATAEFTRRERDEIGLAPDAPPLRRRGSSGSIARTSKPQPAKSPPAQRIHAHRR